MKKLLLSILGCISILSAQAQNAFTPGNLVVLQTSGTLSKASSQVTLKEFTPTGTAGLSVAIPSTGPTPFQSAGIYGGSEGFLTTSTDNKYLVLGGYATAASITDITATNAATAPRAVGLVYPSGFYLQVDTSNVFYSLNDIRGAISNGTNFWASGASNTTDGIDYFAPGPHAALAAAATPPKAYGLRIFNGQVYYSTQKAGPTNSATQLGIFALGTGMPTSGTVTVSQVINTGSVVPEDFSFNATTDVCYIAINLNTAAGGIQKWTRSGSVWSLAYTLGTGAANIGAYGLVVDYSGASPVIYATTFETAGNRIIKITDVGAGSSATTLVAAVANTFYKGITFAPVISGTPIVNISTSYDTASEAGATVVTVTANASAPVTGVQTVNVAVSGTGITAGDYTLSNTTITIPNGATSGSVTFTVVNDILGEGTETAVLTISAPTSGLALGMRTVQRITITDNDGNNHPVITIDTSTTNFIDGAATVSPPSPFKLSGVISDPTDPTRTIGANIRVTDLETPATSLTVWAVSSNTSIVPNGNITITGSDSIKNVKIIPAAVGFSNITLRVTDGIDTTAYIINYGASDSSATPSATLWHTGMSDASDAIAQNDNYYISADDELDVLNVYSRSASGLSLVSYNYSASLSLPNPGAPEVDVEAAAVSPAHANRSYWLGSMSNGKSPFDNKPNRDRIFATTYTGAGATTSFSVVGYAALRTSLLAWGDANGYSFTASAAAGVDSKLPSGFAAEGMVFGPDNTTLYLGLRAPLVPVAARTKAVIAPILNFETWFNDGTPSGSPTYGAPIELNLGGRGIRDMIRLSNGSYVIIAGNPEGSPITSAIYKWTGYATDAPILVPSSVSGTLNMEGVMQINSGGSPSLTSLQVITDNGGDIFYNDGTEAKDFGDLIYRKFRSDVVTGIDLSYPEINVQGNGNTITDGTTATAASSNTDFGNVPYATAATRTFVIQNIGTASLSVSGISFTGSAAADYSLAGSPSFPLTLAPNGTYTITVQFVPSALGVRNTTIVIANNDNDESVYDFSIRGNGICNPPAAFTVSGGGTMCTGGSGFAVNLSSSASGVNYQLFNQGTSVGSAVAGTGSSLGFGVQTAAGIYKVVATHLATGCTSNMTDSALVVVNPLPIAYSLTGGGHYCAGGTGLLLGLSNSQTGVTYQLYSGSTPVGSAVAGGGTAISFGSITAAATYTVTATNTATTCTNAMTGTSTVTIDALPVAYSVTGGGSYCSGGAGVPVGLGNSQTGVNYTLYNGAIAVGSAAPGTGAALSFGNLTTAATYTVAATNATTGCGSAMSGAAPVTVNALPVAYSVTGGGSYCAGGTGLAVGVANSQSGITYQLYNGASAAGTPVSGTGSAVSFGLQTAPGSYSVVATNTVTSCPNNMSSTATVSVDPLPSILAVTGGGSYCAGGTGVHIGLGGSASGINYQLYNGTSAVGTPVAGTGVPLDFGLQTAAGAYTVYATNNTTSCAANMLGTATITITPLAVPAVTVTSAGGTTLCVGTSNLFTAMPVNGGAAPTYQWRINGTLAGATSGSYTYTPVNGDVVMVKLISNAACASPDTAVVSNTMTVIPYSMPFASIAAVPGNILCDGSPMTFTSTVANGGTAPSYTWIKNTTVVGSGPTYSYTPADGDNVILSMTSNKPCRLATTVYSNNVIMDIMHRYLPSVSLIPSPGVNVAQGTTVTLTAVATGGGPAPTYKWTRNNTVIPGATDSSYTSSTFHNNDSVSCVVTGSGACGLQSYNFVLMKIIPLGVSTVSSSNNITVHPNPSAGDLYIDGTTADEQLAITVINALGQNVYSDNVEPANGIISKRISLNNTLPSGVYLLSIQSRSGKTTVRITVER